MRRAERLMWVGVAVGIVGVPVAKFTNVHWLVWVLATVEITAIAGVVLIGRALSRSGPPFTGVRWYWPGGLKHEPRFGHKPWHRVAIVFAAILFLYMTLIMWVSGQLVAGAVCAAIAGGLLALAYVLHRRFSRQDGTQT